MRRFPQKPSSMRRLTASQTPFETVLNATLRTRWKGLRSSPTLEGQARQAIKILAGLGLRFIEEVTTEHLNKMVATSKEAGIAHSTVSYRLSCLSVLGVAACEGFSIGKSRSPKWALKSTDETKLALCPDLHPEALAFFRWTCETGLRIEESLRLRSRMLYAEQVRTGPDTIREVVLLDVPGTKTEGSATIIPLSSEAVAVLNTMGWPDRMKETDLVWRWRYLGMRDEWAKVRRFLGVEDIPTSTMKNLRRAFARRATLKGMPPDVLRQYLRHRSLATTQGYLNIIGGYTPEEIGRFL